MSQLYARSAIHSVLQSPYSAHYQFDNSYNLQDTQYPRSAASIDDDRQYEGQGWKIRPGHKMSDSRPKDYNTPRRTEPAPRREKLPSISSLLSGPLQPQTQESSHVVLPPLIERSPSYPTTSLQDVRRSGAPTYQDRLFQESYQRQPQAEPGHFAYPSRTETERSGRPPPRSIQPAIGSAAESPQSYDPRHSPHESNRTQLSSSSRRSPRSEPEARQDYFPLLPKDISNINQIPNPPCPSLRPLAPAIRGDPNRSSSTQGPQSTPVSSVPVDPNAAKEPLGPKIWTGTQFLPRFVRRQEIPGEGLCFFYDDGTHCKATIDGEEVNAYWGVTKAGKPRKRLAIACVPCREKKIKCDPNFPRCVQCEKLGRVCKFMNMPRTGQGSPETSSAETEESNERPHHSGHRRRESRRSNTEHSKRNAETSPLDQHSAKKRRPIYTTFTLLSPDPVHDDNMRRQSALAFNQEWRTNPVHSYPFLVQELIPLYFSGLAGTSYIFLPSEPMTRWIFSSAPKSTDDLMLIYSMLAIATKYSDSLEHKARGQDFYAVANYAAEHSQNTLQLCQARLNLACYSYSTSLKPSGCWELCSRAFATASAIKLNIEISTSQIPDKTIPYGLNLRGYLECRRRTFWSCYIMDRFNGFYNNHLSFIHPEDIFLRLPLSDASFNAQLPNDNAFFTPSDTPKPLAVEVGPMAYLVGISSIWGDVTANLYRSSNRPTELANMNPTINYDFYEKSISKLQAWRYSLPTHLQPSETNFATQDMAFGTWITMHLLYHAAEIKLNRYIHATSIPTATIENNLLLAIASAREVLRLTTHSTILANPNYSTPFASYLICSAVDIISSRGSLTLPKRIQREFLETFQLAVHVLQKLVRYWTPVRMQLSHVQKRIEMFEEVGKSAPIGMWVFNDRIEESVARELDAVYEVSAEFWENAFTR